MNRTNRILAAVAVMISTAFSTASAASIFGVQPGLTQVSPKYGKDGATSTLSSPVLATGTRIGEAGWIVWAVHDSNQSVSKYDGSSWTEYPLVAGGPGFAAWNRAVFVHPTENYLVVAAVSVPGLYNFADGTDLNTSGGDILTFKVNKTTGAVEESNYVQRTNVATTTSIADTIEMIGSKFYVSGSIEGAGLLMEFEGVDGSVRTIARANLFTKVNGSVAGSAAGRIVIAGNNGDGTHSLVEYDSNTNNSLAEYRFTLANGEIRGLTRPSTAGRMIYVLVSTNGGTGEFPPFVSTAYTGVDSLVIAVPADLSNPTHAPAHFGDASASAFLLTQISRTPMSSMGTFLVAGAVTGAQEGINDAGTAGANSNAVVMSISDDGSSLVASNWFVLNTVAGSDERFVSLSSRQGDSKFYVSDSSARIFSVSDAVAECSENGAVPVTIAVNVETGVPVDLSGGSSPSSFNPSSGLSEASNLGDLSDTSFEGVGGSLINLHYLFNYGITFDSGPFSIELPSGFASRIIDGWAPETVTSAQIIAGLSRDQRTFLQRNLSDAASFNTNVQPAGPGTTVSYHELYKRHGFTADVIEGKSVSFYVDFSAPINASNKAAADAAFAGIGWDQWYVSARAANGWDWHPNRNPFRDSVDSTVTWGQVGGTSMPSGAYYRADGQPIVWFPVKKTLDNSVVAYVEFSCGNFVCSASSLSASPMCFGATATASCGNSVVEGSEECDGSVPASVTAQYWQAFNLSCNSSCVVEGTPKATTALTPSQVLLTVPGMSCVEGGCGNGLLDAGEECDITAGAIAGWSATDGPFPGMFHLSPATDGGVNGVVMCSNACKQTFEAQTCGNGVVEGFEQCDDGNNVGGDGCTTACYQECGGATGIACECGDGVTTRIFEKMGYVGHDGIDETCDNWADNGNTAVVRNGFSCTNQCKRCEGPSCWTAVCGDGTVQEAENNEECESVPGSIKLGANALAFLSARNPSITDNASAYAAGYRCSAQCKVGAPTCGNGVIETGEDCETGDVGCYPAGSVIGGIDLSCTYATCGNGVQEGTEACDDGALNGTAGSSCSATCTMDSAPWEEVACSENRMDGTTFNFIAFNPDNLDEAYDMWTWDGKKFTRQRIDFPTVSEKISGQTVTTGLMGVRDYFKRDMPREFTNNNLIYSGDKRFRSKTIKARNLDLTALYMSKEAVLGEHAVLRSGFHGILEFYDNGAFVEVQKMSCSGNENTETTKELVKVVGFVDKKNGGVYVVKKFSKNMAEVLSKLDYGLKDSVREY